MPKRKDLIVTESRIENEETECEQSDKVCLILNLALLNEQFANDVRFESEIHTQLKKYSLT